MLKKRWITVIIAFIVSWSVILGWGASHYGVMAQNSLIISKSTKSVDKATDNFKIGEESYLENCATCHIPIPPAVLPQETWQTILENPGNHYGTKVGLTGFNQRLMWLYLQGYSRQLLKDERKPQYIAQSRYFFALHPRVNLPSTITLNSCVECHSQARNFDYQDEN
ncbi:dihem cytochrome c family protein [Geminocystis sp. GBBB08]|uniref:dihem cytochrome c family protein n=1 Tax=Geminocystis sp. GBBB08 TaxID=2604140 RepID=UPI0027E33B23|nr:dihem cytochrome c family protein [Geminocystis sp. GBBB08]MBL1210972.1 dihem cytochrome c family protein [Geminocystis sp. GBBB08]